MGSIGVQIDMLRIEKGAALCSLYTENRCVRILMKEEDYNALRRDGFFLRKEDKADSAGVLNTTHNYLKPSDYESKEAV